MVGFISKPHNVGGAKHHLYGVPFINLMYVTNIIYYTEWRGFLQTDRNRDDINIQYTVMINKFASLILPRFTFARSIINYICPQILSKETMFLTQQVLLHILLKPIQFYCNLFFTMSGEHESRFFLFACFHYISFTMHHPTSLSLINEQYTKTTI